MLRNLTSNLLQTIKTVFDLCVFRDVVIYIKPSQAYVYSILKVLAKYKEMYLLFYIQIISCNMTKIHLAVNKVSRDFSGIALDGFVFRIKM
jgi:hypothetical protein